MSIIKTEYRQKKRITRSSFLLFLTGNEEAGGPASPCLAPIIEKTA